MLDLIVEYVNTLFPILRKYYCGNFIKACLVYQYLHLKYFSTTLDLEQIILRLIDWRHSCRSNSPIIANHLIFSLAFREFRNHFHLGRGRVYTFNSPFKNSEIISYLTGITFWRFHEGVVR